MTEGESSTPEAPPAPEVADSTRAPAAPGLAPNGPAPNGLVPNGPARPSRLRAWWPFALVAFLYLATSPYHQGLNNPNEMVRVYATRALVEDGKMAIDKVVREWGGVDDKAIREGKLYSSKAPLQSLLGVPAYWAARPVFRALGVDPSSAASRRSVTTVLRVFASAIPGIIFAWALLAWARRRALSLGASVAAGTGAGLSLALGTMIYPYALTFTGHELAALAAGGCYLAVVEMSRRTPGSPRWRHLALLAGLGAGAAPFAEYPAALVAGPALVAALVVTKTARLRTELLLLLTAGGAPPFLLGLWAHQKSWGSPFKTGYAFLENSAYHELHGHGFFGVSTPKAEAFAGALFSPGTGLFFFSPILIIGLAALVARTFARTPKPVIEEPSADETPSDVPAESAALEEAKETPPAPVITVDPGAPLARTIAIAGLVGFALEVLFISGHSGWRGGWTLGPRYIIPVAPLLAVWVIEALATPKTRPFVAALGAISIVTTGLAAALYPHLSDVFTNPLKTFVVPSYLRGEASYGIAHALGLAGWPANLVHLVPLVLAVGFVAFAGADVEGSVKRRALIVAGAFVAVLGIIAVIPERDSVAAMNENQRLWGFWEPPRPKKPGEPQPASAVPSYGPGFLWRARDRWPEVAAEAIASNGRVRRCQPEPNQRCRYGDQPWQHVGPEALDFGGTRLPLLFLHPIAGETVRAIVPADARAKRAVLRYGLTDASVASGNPTPVDVVVRHGGEVLAKLKAENEPGLHALELTLGATVAPMLVEIACDKDGARVFGFDIELYGAR